eukprot:COSAG01_NODE_1305_length_10807_cov_3.074897_10_plen_87_part_00
MLCYWMRSAHSAPTRRASLPTLVLLNPGGDLHIAPQVVTCIQHSQGTEREVAISESAALCRSTVATAVHSQPAMGDHRSTTGALLN